jgi:alkanesulfonate monooxygenase SsuD/methylene tetrahydromethanopterin reductase-like flavin-dependent oxidoreductase (luciferase family)
VRTGFSIDPDQGLSDSDELRLVTLAADLGYESAWTPSRADALAFDRCLKWYQASGLPVGISAVPASGRSADFYADHARRVWEATGGRFTLVVGSGGLSRAAQSMRAYLSDLRRLLPAGLPLYLAALGPLMLDVGGQLADGVALNWCTADQVAWSKKRLTDAADAAGRSTPRVIEYIRTAVDPDAELARRAVGVAAIRYALGPSEYRRHFERMGFAVDLRQIEASPAVTGTNRLSAIGAGGAPGQARGQFESLASGLDLPIVRIVAVRPGDSDSARRALEECRPNFAPA